MENEILQILRFCIEKKNVAGFFCPLDNQVKMIVANVCSAL